MYTITMEKKFRVVYANFHNVSADPRFVYVDTLEEAQALANAVGSEGSHATEHHPGDGTHGRYCGVERWDEAEKEWVFA